MYVFRKGSRGITITDNVSGLGHNNNKYIGHNMTNFKLLHLNFRTVAKSVFVWCKIVKLLYEEARPRQTTFDL